MNRHQNLSLSYTHTRAHTHARLFSYTHTRAHTHAQKAALITRVLTYNFVFCVMSLLYWYKSILALMVLALLVHKYFLRTQVLSSHI